MADGEGESDSGSGEPNVLEENPYIPNLHIGPHIPHYYGDYVRQLFMIISVAMLVFSPFLAAANPGILPFEIGGALVIVILAALTNPVRSMSMLANAIAAGAGVFTYELLALNAYFEGAIFTFMQREALALLFLLALYFSLKTFRNMLLRMIGKKTRVGDFFDDTR